MKLRLLLSLFISILLMFVSTILTITFTQLHSASNMYSDDHMSRACYISKRFTKIYLFSSYVVMFLSAILLVFSSYDFLSFRK